MNSHSQPVWTIKGRELPLSLPRIMGILNVTPDSFSDGGKYVDPDVAMDAAKKLIDDGADIIDIGGESTRPGAASITPSEEIARIKPVLDGLLQQFPQTLISVDTRKYEVAEMALQQGCHIINDVSGGKDDPSVFNLVARYDAGYVLMHMQGQPKTMQNAPDYEDVMREIIDFFQLQMNVAVQNGLKLSNIVLDPGIGFGKSLAHNLKVMGNMNRFFTLDRPLLLGASRKSFINMIDDSPVEERLGGSIAAVLKGYQQGTRLFRVHDVRATRQALDIFHAIEAHSD